MKFDPNDFRPPEPGDRIVALIAAADARGDLPVKPHVALNELATGAVSRRKRRPRNPEPVGGGR